MKRNCCAALLAHVDAGKTTLSEGLLYTGGMLRKIGRVDKQDTFLDTDVLERERGITIFSKQAVIELPELNITLLDTPGHVDFSAEMERTLQVLDYAVLVISGADGVQGHTRTLWSLLQRYHVPVFLFVNKMDQNGTDRTKLLEEIKQELSDNCVAFDEEQTEAFYENAAMCDEDALEYFLENGVLTEEQLQKLIQVRKLFPVYFGSALKMTGVEELLQGISKYTIEKEYPKAFGARVFKISRDAQGNRLTHLKITGGKLKVRDILSGHTESEERAWEEKVNQIRIYSGEKFKTTDEVSAGEICAVTGLTQTEAGEGLGCEEGEHMPVLEPVLTYQIILPQGYDAPQVLPKLRQLEEEEPELHIVWNEVHQEILVQVMGEVQIEVLKRQIADRFGLDVTFGTGKIVYKETIKNVVEGVGHFEPLRHYAEAHLLLEPLEAGSGMVFAADCSEDVLDKNWQRLILTHLQEKEHIGVLTGSVITDMKITLVGGRAHLKHTEGGDFRQATYRAVRQGLKEAESVLLEPWYKYTLEIPENMVGRAMTDIEKMQGTMEGPFHNEECTVLKGLAPVATMQEYAREVTAYTRGEGHLFLSYGGYYPCHNAEEVIAEIGYDSERDLANPTGSVFCAHGAGYLVEWDKVKENMHVESCLKGAKDSRELANETIAKSTYTQEEWLAVEEVDDILAKTYNANKRDKSQPKKQYMSTRRISAAPETTYRAPAKKAEPKEEYLLVDGYNIIFAWKDLKELSDVNMDGAKGKLLDILCNYQGMKKCQVIVVFDAYRVAGHKTEIFDYHNIHVVYTKEAETADAYIEKFAHENSKKYKITVATSDGLEQIIIRGQGCLLLSARELEQEIKVSTKRLLEEHKTTDNGKKYLLDDVSKEVADWILENGKREENVK
ncbi:MAG: TetM/TetW/TetO/TetS family tetracycline resistance ribosomal protection protein [Lachnospiraceae bacterium]|nr:TetM/TetW/TetO/TetS family tetracycline resistance ribosomal protection protein [Lachnospiraceae bacterium]